MKEGEQLIISMRRRNNSFSPSRISFFGFFTIFYNISLSFFLHSYHFFLTFISYFYFPSNIFHHIPLVSLFFFYFFPPFPLFFPLFLSLSPSFSTSLFFSRLSDLYPCCPNALPSYLGYIWPDMFRHVEK